MEMLSPAGSLSASAFIRSSLSKRLVPERHRDWAGFEKVTFGNKKKKVNRIDNNEKIASNRKDDGIIAYATGDCQPINS
jgi:hypothetical protein